ncbi:MAG TPA: CHASE domain-containing protein [bacterium]
MSEPDTNRRRIEWGGAAPAVSSARWPRVGQRILHHSPWLVLASSLLVTWLVWHSAAHALAVARDNYFDFRVREATTRIVQRMQAYQQVLQGVQALYLASDTVERDEFKTYVAAQRLAEHYPGIQGVGYSLIVPAARRGEHEAAVRAEGFRAYAIRPEGQRDPYTSIVYLEPFADRNLRAFGYDMYSEPVRRAAMERARDTGAMAMSGKVRLVQEAGGREQAGFLLYLPVYRNNLPHDTPAQRRAHILGWAYSPFRMDDLMQGIHGERASDLDIEIYDGSDASTETLMYDSDGSRQAVSPSPAGVTSVGEIEIAGRRWTVAVRALAGLERRIDAGRPALIGFVGVIISLLLSWLTWSLVRGRERAVSAVLERERLIAELQAAMAQVKTLQGILPICSVCKKIRDDKDAWKQMETFISEHSDAVFSHGYCPDCAAKTMAEVRAFSKARGTG